MSAFPIENTQATEPVIRVYTLAEIEASPDLNLLDDGRVSDEFGEILGIVLPDGVTEPKSDELISDSLAKWVLTKLRRHAARKSSAEGVLSGIQQDIKRRQDEVLAALELHAEMIELRATEAGCLAVIKEADKGAGFFVARYIRDLGAWAAAQLGSGKSRTWKEPEGSIQVSKVGEALEIVNEEDAIAFLERLQEDDAVKKSILKSKISDSLKRSG